jgi:hypothetical protein
MFHHVEQSKLGFVLPRDGECVIQSMVSVLGKLHAEDNPLEVDGIGVSPGRYKIVYGLSHH